MSANHKSFDDADDARLVWLLSSAASAPPLRETFAESLSAKLDAEFAAASGSTADAAGAPASIVYLHHARTLNGHANGHANAHASNGHSQNGHSHNGDANLHGFDSRPTLPIGSPRRRLVRRWSVGIAAAASLLIVMAVWSDPPAWANMIRSIVQTIGRYTIGVGDGEAVPVADGGGTTIEEPVAETSTTKLPAAAVIVAEEVKQLEKPVEERLASATSSPPLPKKPEPPAAVEKPPWNPPVAPLAEGELRERIDEQLTALWAAERIHPVGPASDAEFMRRVYLDLTGRVPTVGEARDFLADQTPDRREHLVDRLLAHHDHATHLAAVWRRILLPDEVDLSRLGGSAEFDDWLAERFAENVPYDEIVRELLLAEGRVAESGPLLFYAAVRLNPEELAARTSRAFLGVRMECAQCHDHPFDEVSQQDFWSFAAFFARISRPRGKMEMTSPVLQVKDNEFGDVMIPDSDDIVSPRIPGTVMDLVDEPAGASRREQLVAWLTDRHNQHFAQATVNRVWAHLFGRGLVEPVDDMRPANPAIAPDVLETLAGDFAASGYDLRRLLRELVLTDAYQLSSGAADSDPSRNLAFAQMNMKSFSAEQLYDCITIATGKSSLTAPAMPGADSLAGLVRSADMNRQQFIEQFRTIPGQVTDYQAGIPQALTLMHGGLIHNATDVAASGLLKSLAAPFFNDDQRLDTLYLATLSRYPEDEERTAIVEQMAKAKSTAEKQQVLGDVLWALLNSAEFTLNH